MDNDPESATPDKSERECGRQPRWFLRLATRYWLPVVALVCLLSLACRSVAKQPPLDALTVFVEKSGSILVHDQLVLIDDLEERLRELGADEHTSVVVSTTGTTPFKHINPVLECLGGMGVEMFKVRLRADNPEQ
jgi:biopolymer transport protein ExbD